MTHLYPNSYSKGGSQQARENITQTITEIPATERAELLNLIHQHRLFDGADGYQRGTIITTLATVPTAQRGARAARVAQEIGMPTTDPRYFERVILILEATADAQIPPPAALVHNAALLPDVAGQEA